MFRWLNKQGVESDRGFIVQVIDRDTIEYREGDKVISIPLEFAGGPPGIIVDRSVFARWDNDPPGTVLSPQEQQIILNNLREALKFQSVELILQ